MAKQNAGVQILSGGVAVIALLYVWRLVSGSALIGTYPTNQASAANPLTSLLQSLQNTLKQLGSGKSGGGSGGGSANPNTGGVAPNFAPAPGSAQNFADWVNASNQQWAQNSSGIYGADEDKIFSGTDFVNPANYDTSIETLDLSNLGSTFYPYAGANSGADYSGIYTDFGGGGGGFDPSIGYEDMGSFDIPGIDFAE